MGDTPSFHKPFGRKWRKPSAKEILAELNQSECVNQGHSDLPSPIILDNGLLYLQRMWRYEEQIAQFFAKSNGWLISMKIN